MLCYAMLCYAMICYAMICYDMLCYAMLYYALLCLEKGSHREVLQTHDGYGLLLIGVTEEKISAFKEED